MDYGIKKGAAYCRSFSSTYSITSSTLQPVSLQILSMVSVVTGLPVLMFCSVFCENRFSCRILVELYPASFNFCRMSLYIIIVLSSFLYVIISTKIHSTSYRQSLSSYVRSHLPRKQQRKIQMPRLLCMVNSLRSKIVFSFCHLFHPSKY